MDRTDEALNRLSAKEKQKLKNILFQIENGDFQSLDFKKLKGEKGIFRVRKGDIRVIIRKIDDSIKVLSIERRNSKTYKKNSNDEFLLFWFF